MTKTPRLTEEAADEMLDKICFLSRNAQDVLETALYEEIGDCRQTACIESVVAINAVIGFLADHIKYPDGGMITGNIFNWLKLSNERESKS